MSVQGKILTFDRKQPLLTVPGVAMPGAEIVTELNEKFVVTRNQKISVRGLLNVQRRRRVSSVTDLLKVTAETFQRRSSTWQATPPIVKNPNPSKFIFDVCDKIFIAKFFVKKDDRFLELFDQDLENFVEQLIANSYIVDGFEIYSLNNQRKAWISQNYLDSSL